MYYVFSNRCGSAALLSIAPALLRVVLRCGAVWCGAVRQIQDMLPSGQARLRTVAIAVEINAQPTKGGIGKETTAHPCNQQQQKQQTQKPPRKSIIKSGSSKPKKHQRKIPERCHTPLAHRTSLCRHKTKTTKLGDFPLTLCRPCCFQLRSLRHPCHCFPGDW